MTTRPQSPLALTPVILTGFALTLGGTLIRHASHRAMGKHFMYQLTLQKDHELITGFPYSVVRHPGYTGFFLGIIGLELVVIGPGNQFLKEIVMPCVRTGDTVGAGIASVVLLSSAYCTLSTLLAGFALFRRVKQEDEMLKKEFGKEWEDWACQVPYKLIPGVY